MSEEKRRENFESYKLREGGEELEYHCYYCGNNFKMIARSVGDGNSKCSNSVRCKKCKNILPTWK